MAAAADLSEKVVLETAKDLQTRFLSEHKDDQDMDSRDLARIAHPSLHYVCKFVYHQLGDASNAYNQMVECLKWRKSFGINVRVMHAIHQIHYITFDSIDENFFKSGKSYKHGYDREGNHIVILNLYLHYKDSKRVTETYRWVAFCLECQARVYPDSKVCMIFDSTNAGLSNMDMDLVRFIMNCFKTYYPNFLSPWKIVKSWLSERASSKIKFVTKEDITDYIAPENLLERFGGQDPWKFEYSRKELVNEMERVVSDDVEREEVEGRNEEDDDEDGEGSEDGDVEEDNSGRSRKDEEDEEGRGAEIRFKESLQSATSEGTEPESNAKLKTIDVTQSLDGRRRVSFSANLPPSRQSRFGPEDGVTTSHSAGPEGVLKRSTSEYRRRHVTSILRNQNPRKMSLGLDDGHPIRTPDPQSSPYLDISPSDELIFIEKTGVECKCVITLTNISEQALAYKIKTTAPTRYKVRPSLAILESKSVAKVQVVLVPGNGNSGPVSQDKFLVQYYPFEAGTKVPDQNDSQLPAFWKTLPEQSIREYRLRCQLSRETPTKKAIKSGATPSTPALSTVSEQKPGERQSSISSSSSTSSSTTTTSTSGAEMKALLQKVDKLANVTAELQAALIQTRRLNYVLVVLLIVFIVTLLLF